MGLEKFRKHSEKIVCGKPNKYYFFQNFYEVLQVGIVALFWEAGDEDRGQTLLHDRLKPAVCCHQHLPSSTVELILQAAVWTPADVSPLDRGSNQWRSDIQSSYKHCTVLFSSAGLFHSLSPYFSDRTIFPLCYLPILLPVQLWEMTLDFFFLLRIHLEPQNFIITWEQTLLLFHAMHGTWGKSIFIAYSFISLNSGDAEKQNVLQSFSEIKYQTIIATAFLVRQRAS